MAINPPSPVKDHDFLRLIAILRLAVPYTGIILSTRESATIRRQCYDLGVSQISASSRTHPGGYTEAHEDAEAGSQFSLGDHRSLDEVVADYGINVHFTSDLASVDSTARKAHFVPVGDAETPEFSLDYDVMHVVPPQSAPDWVKASALANDTPAGYVADTSADEES